MANDTQPGTPGLSLQIPQDPHRFHYVRATVRVHAYPDGTLAVFHGPRCLARYSATRPLPFSQTPPCRSRQEAECT